MTLELISLGFKICFHSNFFILFWKFQFCGLLGPNPLIQSNRGHNPLAGWRERTVHRTLSVFTKQKFGFGVQCNEVADEQAKKAGSVRTINVSHLELTRSRCAAPIRDHSVCGLNISIKHVKPRFDSLLPERFDIPANFSQLLCSRSTACFLSKFWTNFFYF